MQQRPQTKREPETLWFWSVPQTVGHQGVPHSYFMCKLKYMCNLDVDVNDVQHESS